MTFLPKTWIARSAFVAALLGFQSAGLAQVPKTDRPVNEEDGEFRFAILPDRNGGMRPDVFERAIAKVKMLQPAFVMSTGDLIDGYTTDPKIWNTQWQEFEELVERLEMPFYYVPGNHDISNLLMLDAWKKRRGDPWFSFVHKNVLFIGLHTEDRPFGGLGAEQIAWVKKTLTDHPKVRWTLLFFHRPLWMEKNQAGYEQVGNALKGRNYTVFSGHLHHYVAAERDGMKHYVLATVGGDSKVRGIDLGEFDHVTWVTMKAKGPTVVNLALDGIVADDVVTEKILPQVDALRNGNWLRVEPTVADAAEFAQLSVQLSLANPTESPLHVQGQLSPTSLVRFEPAQIDHTVPPNQTGKVTVKLIAQSAPVSVHALNEASTNLTLTGGYMLREKEVHLATTKAVALDWLHSAPHTSKLIVLDGDLNEWPAALFTMITRPQFLQEGWDWKDAQDGHFRFAVQQRDGKVFVAIETFDDRVISTPTLTDLQDKLFVEVKTSASLTKLEAIAGTATPETNVRATASGLVGEFAIALPKGDKTFRLNVGWMDHDRPENTKPSVLWWRDGNVTEFGQFTVAP